MSHFGIFSVVWFSLVIGGTNSLDNDLLKTPPMGWLSWEKFGCKTKCNVKEKLADCISEKLFTQIADALIQKGYKEAGYDRVNIDDCWMSSSRDVETGRLLPDPVRFPNGIKYLSDYMHDKGLKLGIYQNFGKRTCMGLPGLIGHLETDANTFAEWEVDMVKLDACFTPTTKLDSGYTTFGRLLHRTGRPMVYSCSWPYYQVHASRVFIIPNWNLISLNCNLFRVYHDIHPNWKSVLNTIDYMGDNQAIFRRYTGPGSWPDPDMLLIGNPGLSISQSQAQMAIWCILPAPLFMSNDPRTMASKFESILLNRNAIDINQDTLAKPGERIFHNQTLDLWRRELSGDKVALVVLNREKGSSIRVQIPMEQIANSKLNRSVQVEVFDIFKGSSSTMDMVRNRDGESFNLIDVHVQPTGVAFLRLTPL